MEGKRICIFLTIITICHATSKENEYKSISEITKKQLAEDKLLANILRARNSSTVSRLNGNSSRPSDQNIDKKSRTIIHGFDSKDNSSCCGSRYNSGSSSRPDPHYHKTPSEGGRYPPQYGERLPVDRYGWQTQGRPPGGSGNTGRPTGGNHGGSYGGSTYAGSLAGDRFSTRPGYGGENSGRPGGYGFGNVGGYGYGDSGYEAWKFGPGKPTGYGSGSYGISGTLADGDEFGPGEPAYPEGGIPQHTNLQAQKAVALKALAGVALIGAAAALATNPVLLPIGVVAGRKKRSTFSSAKDEDVRTNYALTALRNNFPKVYSSAATTFIASPRCVARLTCEIQKKYLNDLKKNVEDSTDIQYAEDLFKKLIRSNVLDVASTNANVKKLVKTAVSIGSRGGNCAVFACNSIKAS